MAKANKAPKSVSDQLFYATARLTTSLAVIAESDCQIDPVELLVIWHLKHYGMPDGEGRPVMLHHTLTELLKQNYKYSDSDISKLIVSLYDAGLVEKGDLTTQERTALFGTGGTRKAVWLQPAGSAKIEQFKALVMERFDTWLSQQPKATQLATRKFQPVALGFAQWLIAHYQPASSEEKD